MLDKTAPSDLAITFRGIPRRLKEAEGPQGRPSDPEIEALVARAATVMDTTADPEAIAEAIHCVPADAWDEAKLDQLRQIALEVGRAMRRIRAEHGQDED
jgi:hypothetical protein